MYQAHALSVSIIILSNVLSPLLLLLLFAKHYKTNIRAVAMVRVFNLTFFIGSALYSFGWAYDLAREYYSLGGFGEHMVINKMFGPHWYMFWFSVLTLSILPLLLGLKRYRGSLILAPGIALLNIIQSLISPFGNSYFQFDALFILYFGIVIIHYGLAYIVVYMAYKNISWLQE